MKKIIFIIFIFVISFCAIGCNLTNSNESNKKTDDKEKTVTEDLLKLEENTPQEWIDLFTFDNVTIILKNNLTIKRGDTYKCNNGEWSCMYQGTDIFEEHNGRNIFDLYFCKYSAFNYDAEGSRYVASGVSFDDSGYLHEIIINIYDGKIISIYDDAVLNSSVITTNLEFSYSINE